jgi:hypothetical protein
VSTDIHTEEITFQTLFRRFAEHLAKGFHCCAVGIVHEVYYENSTLSVRLLNRSDESDGTASQPVLLDVPYIRPAGGSAALNLPVKAGDEVLVLFADHEIDSWFCDGASGVVKNTRRHSISDAVALPCLFSKASALPPQPKEDCAELAYGSARLGVYADGKIFLGNARAELVALIDELIAIVAQLRTTGTAAAQTLAPDQQAEVNLLRQKLALLMVN